MIHTYLCEYVLVFMISLLLCVYVFGVGPKGQCGGWVGWWDGEVGGVGQRRGGPRTRRSKRERRERERRHL